MVLGSYFDRAVSFNVFSRCCYRSICDLILADHYNQFTSSMYMHAGHFSEWLFLEEDRAIYAALIAGHTVPTECHAANAAVITQHAHPTINDVCCLSTGIIRCHKDFECVGVFAISVSATFKIYVAHSAETCVLL